MTIHGDQWEIIIIGGGPAGLSAAMVLARSRRSVLVLDEGQQRNLKSHGLHNFITRDGILPPDFLSLARRQLSQYPVSYITTRVRNVEGSNNAFQVRDASGKNWKCKKVLFATGVHDLIPEVPGMKELWGQSVFHCPFCDGFECRESHIALYSQKHNGYGMALALHHLSKKVSLFTDGAFYLKPAQRMQLQKKGIDIYTRRVARLVSAKGKLEGVALADGRVVPCTSMFTNHGINANIDLLKKLGCHCTRKGAAITNRRQQTNIPGVYVAGDASIDMHFVVVASAEGVKAGVSIHNDLLEEDQAEAMSVKDQ